MKKKNNLNISASDLMPFIIMIAMFILFGITTGGKIFTGTNIKNLFNQSMYTMVAALGMVFVATLGATDITHGALVALSGTFGAIAADAWGFGAFIPVTLLVGVLSGLLIGFLNAKLKVNSFMVSLSLLIAYRAFVNLLLSSKSYTFPKELNFFKETWFEVVALIVLCVLVIYLFHYTRYGVYVRGIGENENAMIHAGVKVTKVKIMAFVLSGLLASLAGIFMLSRIGGTNNLVGSGFEMKVMMAMYIGGIPVEGGMKSKIYKLLIGAPTIILLENGLVLSGIDGSATQLIRGAVLIGVLWVTGFINDKFKYGLKKKPVAALETE